MRRGHRGQGVPKTGERRVITARDVRGAREGSFVTARMLYRPLHHQQQRRRLDWEEEAWMGWASPGGAGLSTASRGSCGARYDAAGCQLADTDNRQEVPRNPRSAEDWEREHRSDRSVSGKTMLPRAAFTCRVCRINLRTQLR